MKKNLIALAMLCGFLFIVSTSLFARGSETPLLTFTVPVTLNNMLPEAKGVRVHIILQNADGRTIVDKKSDAVAIPEDGNLPKTLFTVEFFASDGPIVAEVTQYRCELIICRSAEGGGGYAAQPAGETSETLQYCTAKAGTPFVGSVTGTIEW